MKYPRLVIPEVCRTPIRLVIEAEETDEDGAPVEAADREFLCSWQDGGTVRIGGERRYVRLFGRAYIDGDICPELPAIVSGYAVIFGVRRRIIQGVKARNPDGTVNFTEVRLA